MKQNYFIYYGKSYGSGTTIVVKYYDHIAKITYETEAIFLYYDPKLNAYAFKFKNKDYINIYPGKAFYDIIVSVLENKIDSNYINYIQSCPEISAKKWTLKKELSIDSLLIAWVWYLFIMAIGTIFKGNVLIWIFASLIFFSYRNTKLKERGFK